MDYPRRYEATRWRILYGSYDGVEKLAVNQLQANVQRFLPYVIAVEQGAVEALDGEDHLIVIGTAESNPIVAQAVEEELVPPPPGPEGYSIACVDSPWNEGKRVLIVAGSDPNGALYGVQEFDSYILRTRVSPYDPPDMREAFDKMRDFGISEKPAIDNRGIWTWGYVIYDYRRFIDNMVRCRMNQLTIWNDCPPLNSRDVIDYAHSRGVKIVMGFHWGWGIHDFDPTNDQQREHIRADVVRNYVENYRGLGIDGIYFQTFTEHSNLDMGGKSTAALACDWVNCVAHDLYEVNPELRIEFGLHATSIRENYSDLEGLDPRIVITWEDAGVMPYSYNPLPGAQDNFAVPETLDSIDATIEYSKRLATFRPGTEFAMVPKGWTTLRWMTEFEHHGPFILGERDREWIRLRGDHRQPTRWDFVNAMWAEHYPHAVRFFREVLDCHPPRFTATVLIEDGLFEEKIQLSAALMAEILWNPRREDGELMQRALSAHYGGC